MSYESLKSDLRGVAFTNPTPFSEDGADVRHDELAQNVATLRDAGAQVVIPCGNTGEYYSLSDAERVSVVETTAEAMDGQGSIVAGAGGSTKHVLDLAEQYADVGADALLVMYPVHTYMHNDGVREYYERIAAETDLGVVIYKRGERLADDVIADLTRLDSVVGVKYAHNDIKAFAQLVADASDDVVLSNGIAERFCPSFAIEGAEGFTTGIGNFVPEEVLALMDALREEDYERAREIRDVLRPFEDLREESGPGNHMSAANNVPAVKHAMDYAGLYGGPVREPLVELAEEDARRAEAYYDEIKDADV